MTCRPIPFPPGTTVPNFALQDSTPVDCEPKGAVAHTYGVCDPMAGRSGRLLVVIDGSRFMRGRCQAPVSVNPGADGIRAALDTRAGQQGRGSHE